jgi:cytoskeletal protein RodZ
VRWACASNPIDTPATPAYIRWDRRIEEKMTKGSFGDHLKREREMRGVSLDEISAATRIAPRFLQAIENDEWDQLPGGVFNRGFVRAVARYLGLDDENLVAEYAAAVGDGPGVPVWTGSPPAVTPDKPWLVWALAAVVVLVILTGGWFAVRRIFGWHGSRHAEEITATDTTPSTGASALPLATEPASVSAEAAPIPSPDASPAPHTADSPPEPAANPPSAGGDTPFELKVQAGKTTRVTVEADAHRVFQGTMKAGEGRVFTARDKIEVSARDAGALQLELNGKTLAPIGRPGHQGKATLTRGSTKETAGGAN